MKITLRQKFTLGILALCVVVLAAVLSTRLLSKAALFHHLERDHLAAVSHASGLLVRVTEGGKSSGSVSRSELIEHLHQARALARQAGDELFAVEQLAFEAIGFAEILRLPRNVIEAVDRMDKTFAADAASPVSLALAQRLAPDLAVMHDASDRFGPLVADATRFIRTTSILLNTVALSVLFLVFFMLRAATLQPIQRVVQAAERMAQGDLIGPSLPRSDDEMGQLAQAMDSMRNSLSTLVAQVLDRSAAVDTAVSEVTHGSNDLSSRTEQQASALQQTAAGVSELSGALQASASSVEAVESEAAQARALAEDGGQAVQQAVARMNEILAASRKIADINGVIDGIAFQTNILALNAAVEAARAGEQGRGFAVVASEVRALAQRSAGAAKEIASLIGDTVQKVEVGAVDVQRAGSTMGQVVGSVEKVSSLTTEVSQRLGLQKRSIQQIDQSMRDLDGATQQNAALAEQSSAAAELVRGHSTALVEAVGRFRLTATA